MSPPDRPVVVQLRKTSWIILAFLLIAPWVALVMVVRDRPAPVTAPKPSPLAAAQTTAATGALPVGSALSPEVTRVRPGPWGELEYYRILIEPPEQLIAADYTKPDVVQWLFKGYTDASLAQLWRDARLDPAQQKLIDEPQNRERTPEGIVIRPSRELVISLSPESRAKVYGALAAFPENGPQFSPFRLRADAAAAWFDESGLAPATIALTRKMLYRRGTDAVFFSDDDIVLPTLETAGERVKFLKTLARKVALFVQLRVRPGTDVEPIVRYWGHSRRAKDLRPLLQSLARRPEGGTIDIVHLLPSLPRSLLFTYPLPPVLASQKPRDCLWTSFNFFNDPPDDRFVNPEVVGQTILKDYYPLPGEPTYGDIIVFVRPDGIVLHSCVFLADDLVYTKNGSEFSVPWQIATLEGVKELYSLNVPNLEIRRYRRLER